MAAWLGFATTTFYSASNSVQLKTRSGEKTSLVDLVKKTTPSCHLNPLLLNGHLQTAYTVTQTRGPQVRYKRKIFQADDPRYAGSFTADFVVHTPAEGHPSLPERTSFFNEEELKGLGSSDSRPMLIALHGLSGGSHEDYLRHVLTLVATETSGWEAMVINARGCALSKITTNVLFNARATWDVRQLVKWVREKFPNRPLYGVGFSLGANILTNYVSEEGANCQLKAAVACSNPWNLDVSSVMLARTWLGNAYLAVMGASVKRLFFQHEEQIMKDSKINLENVKKVKYLWEFDREVQCPTWGYPTEGAYYRDASSVDAILDIQIPFLGINAEDDPIAVKEAIPYREIQLNPYTVLCTTSLGGHLGWFEMGGHRWFARAITEFFNTMSSEIEGVAPNQRTPLAAATDEVVYGDRAVFDPQRRRLHFPSPHSE